MDTLPFEFAGGDHGVLLVHGFTGAPFEMKYLGQKLADRGFTVSGPRLAGHGDTVTQLDATRWPDWAYGIERDLERLRKRTKKVAIVGMSLGGLLTLHLARRDLDLAAIAVLGTPLWLPRPVRWAARAVRWLERRSVYLPAAPKIGGSDVSDLEMKRVNPSLDAFPLTATTSLVELCDLVRAELPDVKTPTLVIHADHDHVAPPACAQELVARLGSRDVKLVTLPRSFHIVSLDVERDQVAESVGTFLSERM